MNTGRRLAPAALAVLALAGCGKPEDTSIGAPTPVAAGPPPPAPAWSAPLMGKLLSQVTKGRGPCAGVFDVVSQRFVKPRPGVLAEGWGWDVLAKQPLKEIVFVDASDRIVGAADGGGLRTDVPAARPDVPSPHTGWKGVIDAVKGQVSAIGVTQKDAACDLGSKDVGPDAY